MIMVTVMVIGNILQGMVGTGDFTKDQALFAFDLCDTNGNGLIDIGEFVLLMFPSAKEVIFSSRCSLVTLSDRRPSPT